MHNICIHIHYNIFHSKFQNQKLKIENHKIKLIINDYVDEYDSATNSVHFVLYQ